MFGYLVAVFAFVGTGKISLFVHFLFFCKFTVRVLYHCDVLVVNFCSLLSYIAFILKSFQVLYRKYCAK